MQANWKAAVILAACALSSPLGLAQAAEAEYTLPEVVVTATKTGIDVKKVPASVQVITREQIDAIGAQNLTDALRLANGVHLVQASGNRHAVSIRGFDSRFSTILIDGRRLAAEPDQAFELDRVAIANVERIEIVRGPVSSLYGTDALGGVVNIITKKSAEPSFTLGANYGFYGGGDNVDNYNFTYHSGQQGRVAFSLSGSYRDTDAMFKSNGFTYEPYGTRRNLEASLDYQLSDDETLNLTAGYMKEKTHEVSSKNPLGAFLKTWDDNLRNEQSISYTRKLEDGEVFFRYYQGVLRKNRDVNLPNGNFANWVQARRTMRSYEGRLTKAYGDDHVVTFGAEYRPEKFAGTAVNTGEGKYTAYNPRANASKNASTAYLDYTAVYIQDEWEVSDKLLAITSFRYDDSNKFDSKVSPKIGLTYNLADDTRLKLNAGKGYRTPTPNQLYQLGNGTSNNPNGNSNLKPEESNSYDLSLERDYRNAALKLTYFYNDVSNLINLDNTYTYQNIDEATLQGVEAEYTRTLSDRVSWTNGYTYLDAVDASDNSRLKNRARNILTSRLTYADRDTFSASFWAEVYDSYLLPDVQKSKSYTLWNVSASQKLSANTKLTLTVNNIFDKKDIDLPLMGIYVQSGVQFSF
ncbi:MAG: TonB-dependent receptor [Sporomusaceae bacterium]|nr:TonB-dependent receptor [Sporomusaceae bacterium]